MTEENMDGASVRPRRSTRSTRGSIKPAVVDLTLDEDSQHVEEENEEDDDDVEFVEKSEPTKKKTRQSATKAPRAARAAKETKAVKETKVTKATKATKNNKDNKEIKSNERKIQSDDVQASQSQVSNEDLDNEDIEVDYELSEKEMKEINNAFDMNCNQDGEELLDSDNLKTAIRSLGFEPRADEIQKLLKKFSDKKGKINRDKFHRIMAFKMGSSPGTSDNVLNDEISRVFNLLDLDKTGLITLENLRSISKELNEEITDEELHEMITEADTDGDFQINKLEFYNIMKKTSLY